MKIVTLIENTTSDPNLVQEPGLSLYIETQGKKLLFDMGVDQGFTQNATALGVDLKAVQTAFVSHAHFDHGGGLVTFLRINPNAPVYLGPGADGAYFANVAIMLPALVEAALFSLTKNRKKFSRPIGLDKTLFNRYAHRLQLVSGDTEIDDHIFLLTQFEHKYPLAEGNKYLLMEKGGKLHADTFSHEILLVVQEPDGLVVITGCGHSGILNMMAAVRKFFGELPIKAVVGGLHLARSPIRPAIAGRKEDILFIADELLRNEVGRVYTGHCTGEGAYTILKERLGEKLGRLQTGAQITL